jgi:flagellar basal-body rod modification protein FlgD
MTTTSAYSAVTGTSSAKTTTAKTGLGGLDQGDFLKLMTVQMQQQDPFNPVDQKEMLAQMAQFSSLAGTAEMGETLKSIATKLDAVLKAQGYATTPETATDTSTATTETASGTSADTTSQEN